MTTDDDGEEDEDDDDNDDEKRDPLCFFLQFLSLSLYQLLSPPNVVEDHLRIEVPPSEHHHHHQTLFSPGEREREGARGFEFRREMRRC